MTLIDCTNGQKVITDKEENSDHSYFFYGIRYVGVNLTELNCKWLVNDFDEGAFSCYRKRDDITLHEWN